MEDRGLRYSSSGITLAATRNLTMATATAAVTCGRCDGLRGEGRSGRAPGTRTRKRKAQSSHEEIVRRKSYHHGNGQE